VKKWSRERSAVRVNRCREVKIFLGANVPGHMQRRTPPQTAAAKVSTEVSTAGKSAICSALKWAILFEFYSMLRGLIHAPKADALPDCAMPRAAPLRSRGGGNRSRSATACKSIWVAGAKGLNFAALEPGQGLGLKLSSLNSFGER